MKLHGMTAQDVDHEVAKFAALMQKGMKAACAKASSHALALTAAGETAASDGELTYVIDGLSVMTTEWGQYVTGSLMPALEAAAKTAAKTIASPLGEVPAVKTEQFIADMENKVTSFSAELWDTAKASLIAGAQDGESIAELATRIEQVASVKSKKAHVIAQTSVIAAINGGEWQQMLEAAKAFDVNGIKEWEATEDSHTRPTHAAADGQRVPLDAHFTVGGSLLLFPGDPDGAPSEIISCRCTTLYDLDVEEPLTAAVNAEFNAMHPRGKDGKFIEKGKGLPGELLHDLIALKGGKGHEDLPHWGTAEKEDFVKDLNKITAKQWANLEDVDKEALTKHADEMVNANIPGSATAVAHLEDLEGADVPEGEPDLFDPNTALPVPPSPKKVAELKIYDAYDAGKIDDEQQQALLDVLDMKGPEAAEKKLASIVTPSPPVTGAPTITTGNATPLKITHGLIHAKHAPGTVIATNDDGDTLTWNGTSYDIHDANGDIVTSDIKKSKLYAHLGTHFSGSTWYAPGKKNTNVTHATPLDAAPPAAPIPHPVSGLAPLSHLPKAEIDKQLKFGLITPEEHAKLLKDNGHTNGPGTGAPVAWPSTPGLVNDNSDPFAGTSSDDVKAQVTSAYFADKIDAAQFSELNGHINNGTMSPEKVKKQLDAYVNGEPSPATPNVGTSNMWDTTGLSAAKIAEMDKLKYQYDKGLMTTVEAQQQIDLLKKGPEPGDLAKPYGVIIPSVIADSLEVSSPSVLDHEDLAFQVNNDFTKEMWNALDEGEKGKLFHAVEWHEIKGQANQDAFAKIANFVAEDKNLAPGTDTGGVAPGTPLLHEDIVDTFNVANDGDVLAVGVTPGGTPYELSKMSSTQVSAKNTTNGVESWLTLDQLQSATASSKIAWQKPGGPNAPTPPSVAVTPPTVHSAPSVTPAVKFEDLSYDTKSAFYQHFKAEKVSPAWSGAKIYKSMHAAKAKMSGNPQVAGLSDAEMLKLIDWGHHSKSTSSSGIGAPSPVYTDKVKEWLKTPNGQKAYKDLNPAIASNPVNNPHLAPLPSVAKKTAKKVAKKVTPSSGLSADEALGDSSIDPLLDAPKVFASFKNANYGKYLSDKPEHIYWNAFQQSKNVAHSTPGSILALVDEESAKKFGVPNEQKYTEKVKAWLKTPTGKVKAAQIKAGTYSPGFANPASSASYGSSGFGTSYSHPANEHINKKVGPPLQQVEEFDPNKGYDWSKFNSKDFPVITEAKAKQMTADWNAQQGAMNATQKAALRKYTGSSYDPMNDYLRGYQGATDQIAKDVMNAQKGMRLSLEPIVLHRGNGWFNGWNSVEEVKSHLGEDFHQGAFFSASIGGKSAFSGPINFVIECPPGTPMAFVDTFSQHPSEEEMLLGANINYRVVEVIEGNKAPDNSQHYSTKVTVRLRVVPPDPNAIDVDTTTA